MRPFSGLSLWLRRLVNRTRAGQPYWWLAVGILCLGLSLRLLGLGKDVWLDEASTIHRIRSPHFVEQLRLSDHPPLYYILLKSWARWSDSEAFLRLLSVLFGMGVIVAVMEWLRSYSLWGSLLVGLVLATLPMMLRYSQELKGYALLLCATALSFCFVSRVIANPERWSGYVGLGLSLSVAVATHAVGVMLLASVCVFGAISPSGWRRIRLGRVALALAVPACLFALLFLVFLKAGPSKEPDSWWVPPVSGGSLLYVAKELAGVNQDRLPFWIAKSAIPGLEGWIMAFLGSNLDIAIVSGLLLGSLALGRWTRSLPFLGAAIAYWGQMIVYSIVVVPILIDRTALPGMIPFVGFIGVQIATIPTRKLKMAVTIGLGLLCLVFAANWVRNESGKPIEAWDEIAQVLQADSHPGDIFVLYPDHVSLPLSLYAEVPFETALAISTEADVDTTKSEINALLATTRADSSVFLIVRDRDLYQRTERYQRLVAHLESKLGEPTVFRELGKLSVSKYEYRKLNLSRAPDAARADQEKT